MFPTVRLLIAAMFASVVVLSCGFGVFAAFRVNHEPLVLQSTATVPLKFAAGEAGAASPQWGVPFGPELRVNGNSDAAMTDAPAPTPIRNDIAASNQWTGATVRPAAMTDALPGSAHELAEPLAATALTAPPTLPVPTPAAPADQAPAAQAVPAVVASAPAPLQAEPAVQPPDITGSVGVPPLPEPKVLPEGKQRVPVRTERKVMRKPAKRPRVAGGKRPQRAPAPTVAQSGGTNSSNREPVFQSAPHFQQQAPQPKTKTARYPVSNSPFGYSSAQ